MYSSINNYVLEIEYFTTQELNFFNKLLDNKTIKKRTYLLKPDEIAGSLVFVKRGCLRSFYVNQIGSEISLDFGIENSWIGDIESFYNQRPSKFFIEAIENTEYISLSYEALTYLLKEIPRFEKVLTIMSQKEFSKVQERLIKMVTSQSRDRYLDFIKSNPTLPSRITQLQIATYLGITPEFLSKMKHELIEDEMLYKV